MRENRLQQVLAAGGVPVGHMVMEFATRGIARLLESSGVDFALFDMEHSGVEISGVADMLAWCHGTSFTPFVRVPEAHYHFLARVMDAGAMGVMVANVESADHARDIVSAVKYPPVGRRGLGLGTAHNDYVMPQPTAYLEEANAKTTVICQIESPVGVANAAEIAAVPGVDVLWVGHFDLTANMGILAQFDHPDFLNALRSVAEIAHAAGKAAGIQPGNMAQAQQWRALGYNVLSWSSDIGLYRAALQEGVASLRQQGAAKA